MNDTGACRRRTVCAQLAPQSAKYCDLRACTATGGLAELESAGRRGVRAARGSDLKDLKELRDVVFYGNDIQRELDEHSYRIAVLSAIPQVKKIDGKLVTPIEREEASNS